MYKWHVCIPLNQTFGEKLLGSTCNWISMQTKYYFSRAQAKRIEWFEVKTDRYRWIHRNRNRKRNPKVFIDVFIRRRQRLRQWKGFNEMKWIWNSKWNRAPAEVEYKEM